MSRTIRPSRSSIVRSAYAAATALCVTRMMVNPRSRWRVLRRSRIVCPVRESRLPVGSSATSRAGSVTRARARATRCCSPGRRAPPDPQELERPGDVLLDGEAREEIEALEHEADLPEPQVAQRVDGEPGEVAARHDDPPGARPIESGEQIEERRLARPARPHDGEKLTRVDRERDVRDHRRTGAVAL